MKKIVIVVRDGCVENVFIDAPEKVEVEIVDLDSAFPSKDEQEELARYVDDCQRTMYEI